MEIRDRIKELRRVKASELIADERNWRRHPDYQKSALEGLLAEVGFADALLARETPGGLVLIDGHLRADTVPEMEVPVLVLDVDEAEAQKLLVSLDPLASMAVTDMDALMGNLQEVEFESASVNDMLEALANDYRALAPIGEPEVPEEESFDIGTALDEAEVEEYEPFTKRGQVWQLGRHRLMCGNATSGDNVAKLLVGEQPLLMVTDPPYGVHYDPAWRSEAAAKGHLSYADRRVGEVSHDDIFDWSAAFALAPASVAYVWHADRYTVPTIKALEACKFEARSQIIWGKSRLVISRGHYHWQHEPCWYAVKKGSKAHWVGGHSQSTLWQINPSGYDRSNLGHGTQKPLECMERPIRNHEGDVYDPFVGSGTTIIAAERQNRVCYAIEIEPRYCDVAIRRWEDYTGEKAVLRDG